MGWSKWVSAALLATVTGGALVLLGNALMTSRSVLRDGDHPAAVAVATRGVAAAMPAGIESALAQALNRREMSVQQARGVASPTAILEDPAQHLSLSVGAQGVQLSLRHAGLLGVRLLAVTADGRALAPGYSHPVVQGSRISLPRGSGLTEWYVSRPDGIEQGFTLAEPLTDDAAATHLSLAFSGALRPELARGEIRFTDNAGRTLMRYGGLLAYDANHRRLPARFSLQGRTLRLSVETRNAVYPVTIDPLFSVSDVITEPTPVANDEFGYAVALSGDGSVALVGSPSTPAAYVFTYSKGVWLLAATLSDPGASTSDEFGQAVALSADGTQALIGAPGVNKAYLYGSSSGTWNTTASHVFSDPDNAAGDEFGASVAIAASGNAVLIGAHHATVDVPDPTSKSAPPTPVSLAGKAYAYAYAASSWSSPAVFRDPQQAYDDQFGFAVVLVSGTGGDTALIGAPDTAVPDPTSKSAPALASAGAAYVYKFSYSSSSGKWSSGTAAPSHSLTEPTPATPDEFGYAVALSADGSAGLVSAPFAAVRANGAAQAGAGKVYQYTGGAWSDPTELDDPTVASAGAQTSGANENFGSAVALSPDDTGALIGAPGAAIVPSPTSKSASPAVLADAGKVYAYSVAQGSWPPQASSQAQPQAFSAPGETTHSRFASSVAIAAVSSSPVPAVNGLAGGPLLSVVPPASSTTLTGAGSVLALYTGIDLSLALSATTSPVQPGSSITYKLTVTNNDPDLTASNVVLTDTLPASVSYVSASSGCTNASGTVTCTLATLGPKNSLPWQPSITVKAPSARTVVADSAAVSADQRDQGPSDNLASVNTSVAQAPTATTGITATVYVSGSGQLSGSVQTGQTASYVLYKPAANGTVVVNSNGSYTYTASAAYLKNLSAQCGGGGNGSSGTDSFQFEVSDGTYTSSPATVTITVWPGPTACPPPPPPPETVITTHGTTPYTGQLVGLDPDPAKSLTYGVTAQPIHGTVAVTAGGAFTYTPSGNYTGTDSFTFSVTDAYGNTGIASVTIQDYVALSVNDGAFTLHGTTSNLPLVLTGSEPDPTQIPAITIVTAPSHGTITLGTESENAGTFSQTFTYTSTDPGYTGSDSFTFTAKDSYNISNTGTTTLTVYTPPVANDSALIAHVNAAGSVTAQESDPTQQLVYKVTTPPAHGSLTTFNTATGAYTYQANSGYSGPDSFQFTAADQYATSNTATVSVTDFAAPMATNGSLTAHGSGSGNLVASDPDSKQLLTYGLVTQPAHGAVTLNATTGAFTYKASVGYSGPDSFTFNTRDSYNSSNTATINITAYATPVAKPGVLIAHVQAAGVLSASDPDPSQSLTYQIVQKPQYGSVNLNAATGAYTYTANSGYTGSDSFTFNVSDSYNASNTAAVSVQAYAAPSAGNATLAVHGSTSGKLAASDPDSKLTLTYAIVVQPAHGTLSLAAATGAYTYTADAGYTGSDSFTFSASDSYNTSNVAAVSVIAYGPPTAGNVPVTVAENGTASGQLQGADSDRSQTLAYAEVSQPAHGQLSLDASTGAFVYTPASGFSGTDGFSYTVKDAYAASNAAAVTITVTAAPISGGSTGGGVHASGPPASVSPSGGGALGWFGLLLLTGLMVMRRRK